MNYRIKYSDELYHHGVKGQKWGVRRKRPEYTNKYSTSEGLARAASNVYNRRMPNASKHKGRTAAKYAAAVVVPPMMAVIGIRRASELHREYKTIQSGGKWVNKKVLKANAKDAYYKKADALEDKHEKQVTALNRKYGQYKNNFEGTNAKLSRKDKKQYNKQVENLWNEYSSGMDAAKKEYKAEKKRIKRG